MAATELLGPGCYRGYLAHIGEGSDASTHKALVAFHGQTEPSQAYVKVYCAATAPRGLANEFIGYALAKAAGLEVPAKSAILRLNPSQSLFLPSGMSPQLDTQGNVIAWCVEELSGESPKQLLTADAAAYAPLAEEIRKWPQLADTVALDDWLVNEDRNLGNLIRIGPRRFALIDHGRVCTGLAWNRPLDRAVVDTINKLALIAWGNPLTKEAPPPSHSQLFESINKLAEALASAEIELDHWLPQLMGPEDESDVRGFLDVRTSFLPPHYQAEFGLIA
ncbi:hypothetical protein [Stenotrophomonas panacihumi]|uniref:hypothetical protein n=1 Tax=Stenotrophomonas panacihumi TaxID=676599 RepID=UPI000A87C8CD|nr:hypothetical protein [Stenotrophomonas panacihumi]